ncbi:MAG: adenylosuccinate lyase [Chloroflexi bacterium]|nr:adenylosuccinate lyase [Chloroflexota bacterium]
MSLDYETYLSPFTWRYGSDGMRRLWSEAHKRRLYRRLWLALAETQAEFGLVTPEQVEDLRAHVDEVDVPRALEIEAEIHHDLMAEIKLFAGQAPLGGAILHLGATSADIEDNADVLRIRQALDLMREKLEELLLLFAEMVERWAETPLMAFTHIQPAEPSTLGYRLAFYAQDLLTDWRDLQRLRAGLRGKGFKGAVGTGAAYADLIGVENLARFEARLSERLELSFFPVATQVYPRKQDYQVISALSGLGASLYKFAFDLRLLQSPPLGELSEPFGAKQVGSSAMPFKRNPVNAEKIDSLARLLAGMPRLAWDNAAHSLLERTLDDSANRRTLLPEAFLIADELLHTAIRILKGLQVNEAALARNLSIYGPFAASERILMALARAGADRQAMHERLRQHALAAWEAVQAGQANPLGELVAGDPALQRHLPEAGLRALLDASRHLGDAPARARAFAKEARAVVLESETK